MYVCMCTLRCISLFEHVVCSLLALFAVHTLTLTNTHTHTHTCDRIQSHKHFFGYCTHKRFKMISQSSNLMLLHVITACLRNKQILLFNHFLSHSYGDTIHFLILYGCENFEIGFHFTHKFIIQTVFTTWHNQFRSFFYFFFFSFA